MNQMPRPSNKLYGVTHDPKSGAAQLVEPRTVKVSIGLPKGRAIHVYIDIEGQWVIVLGSGKDAKRGRFKAKEDAQRKYRELWGTAPNREYPERLPYFTFLHPSASGEFEPDWDVIESHGPLPTEIDITFIRDDPFEASYQMWSTKEKQCTGDGKIAERILALADTKEEKELAAQAQKRGEKYFPIVDRCWLNECKYSKPSDNKPSPCRPMGRLFFQLLKTPRLGATAVYNTAGYKSIKQLFSSIETFKHAGRGFICGIPLKMLLQPYRVTYNGRTATQFAVSLEFRPESALALRQSLVDYAVQYRIAGAEQLKQIENMAPPELPAQEIPEEHPAAIAAEFAPTCPGGEQSAPPDPEGEGNDSGPGGALEHAWDDATQPVTQGNNASHVPGRISKEEAGKFYELCRQRGMTDSYITEKLGSLGYESQQEIQTKDLSALVEWAKTWAPSGQGSLL